MRKYRIGDLFQEAVGSHFPIAHRWIARTLVNAQSNGVNSTKDRAENRGTAYQLAGSQWTLSRRTPGT